MPDAHIYKSIKLEQIIRSNILYRLILCSSANKSHTRVFALAFNLLNKSEFSRFPKTLSGTFGCVWEPKASLYLSEMGAQFLSTIHCDMKYSNGKIFKLCVTASSIYASYHITRTAANLSRRNTNSRWITKSKDTYLCSLCFLWRWINPKRVQLNLIIWTEVKRMPSNVFFLFLCILNSISHCWNI